MTLNVSAATPPISLALAGGGPLGAIYEVGALAALSEALPTLDFTRLHSYVGVSAGAYVTAGLANGITPREMVQLFIENEGPDGELLQSSVFMRPAFGEYGKRMAKLPVAISQALWSTAKSLKPQRIVNELQRLSAVLPTGLFDNGAMESGVRELLSKPGRTNDFRELKAPLFLIATDLDSGETVEFGSSTLNHVPISQAVQASSALPAMYPPVKIGARHYVDGALNKTLHASSALKAGAKLVICINPLVPFDGTQANRTQAHLSDRGLPTVLSQTFRSLIHSRLEKSLESYAKTYPDARLVVLEPSKGDADLFFSNVFSYANRRRMAEHAYQHTRQQLLEKIDTLTPLFAQYGVRLNERMLRDKKRKLLPTAKRAARGQVGVAATQLTHALDDLEVALLR
ncbi:MAG: patatin family protein [Betaproteobacteria bacterium]|nr:MAG: patatin family protein [Betaproteobacteria bacterium]